MAVLPDGSASRSSSQVERHSLQLHALVTALAGCPESRAASLSGRQVPGCKEKTSGRL
jgi:hypothetical protein